MLHPTINLPALHFSLKRLGLGYLKQRWSAFASLVGARDWTRNQSRSCIQEHSQHKHIVIVMIAEVPVLSGVTDRWADGRNVFIDSFQLSRSFTWFSAEPLTISSAAEEHGLCSTLRALLSTFSNTGYERTGFVTTLYQVHKFLSVWMRSVWFCVAEETNGQRPGVEDATDSSIGQYGALLWRADMPEGACPQFCWTTSCACLS
jgi:hypothetical protein